VSGSSLKGTCPADRYLYRITARGFGGNSNTQVTLQMIVHL
jgi:Tfp pilus assembly protein PilX